MIGALAASLLHAPVATNVEADASYLIVRVKEAPTYVGTPPECAQPDIICMLELQDARVTVVRNLGGQPTPRRLLMRSPGHHHYVAWRRSATLLVRAVPFVDGKTSGWYATFWQPVWGNEICVTQVEANSFTGTPLEEMFADGAERVAEDGNRLWEAGEKLICSSEAAGQPTK